MNGIYNEGVIARREGKPLNSNPYFGSFEDWDDWRDGWLSEDRKLRLGDDE